MRARTVKVGGYSGSGRLEIVDPGASGEAESRPNPLAGANCPHGQHGVHGRILTLRMQGKGRKR